MQTAFTQKFKKQVDSCKDKRIRKKLFSVIDKIASSESLLNVKNIKKLKGSKNCYRIRVGDFRVGIIIDQETVTFAAFDHRTDIYKYFP